MGDAIEKITRFNETVFRNTVGINLGSNAFDDLSDNPSDWAEAERATDFSDRFTVSELQYNAIDYVFNQRGWYRSRFSDGSFPVWYGSMELTSTFYETVFHWKRFMADSSGLLRAAGGEPVYHARTVFNVSCQSTLVDFREKVSEFPFLVSKDNYSKTQDLGLQLFHEGLPGLISQSARYEAGTNIIVFKKKSLKDPAHQGDYLYWLDPTDSQRVEVLDFKTRGFVMKVV